MAAKAKPLRTSVEETTADDVRYGTITAKRGDRVAGSLRFEEYQLHDKVRIAMIRVEAKDQREGVATAMVKRLRKECPTVTLAPPALNADGRALMSSIFDRFAMPTE